MILAMKIALNKICEISSVVQLEVCLYVSDTYISVTLSFSHATLQNQGVLHVITVHSMTFASHSYYSLLSAVSDVFVTATILDHHGMYCVGSSLAEAFFVSYHLNQACEVQVSNNKKKISSS
jgi:Class II Aldolase and Adducin N-terminal domain